MNARATHLPPVVSVVVPTYRRPDLLERCLDALCVQVFDPTTYEIVVVDDDPAGSARPVVDACRARVTDVPVIRYMTAPDTQGPAGARNVGWRSACGALIAFTDDDTIPDPTWLRHGAAALLAEPSAAAAAGRIDVPLRPCPTDYERDAAGLAHAEFATANCFVRRAALERVGGFDERFTRAWREDADLMFALREHAGPIVGADAARIVHPVRPAHWGPASASSRRCISTRCCTRSIARPTGATSGRCRRGTTTRPCWRRSPRSRVSRPDGRRRARRAPSSGP